MSLNNKKYNKMNEIIYGNIESILKKLNRRIHFRFYAIQLDESKHPIKMDRVKKTISSNIEERYAYIHDSIPTIEQVFRELNVDENMAANLLEPGKIVEEIRKPSLPTDPEMIKTEDGSRGVSVATVIGEQQVNDNQVMYSAVVKMMTDKKSYEVIHILALRNLEQTATYLFNEKPEISFLRFMFDYLYSDFFEGPELKLTAELKLNRKYQEDATQFLRRVSRLFYGKIQNLFGVNAKLPIWGTEWHNELRNEYYINNLLEKIDDISTKTYEGASPFGSIFFLNKSVILDKEGPIAFAIRFKEEDRINLEDAKRIRKLIELTNPDKHFYLIADQEEIYGLGEVRWGMLRQKMAFWVEFKGLSKYNLMMVEIKEESPKDGKLIREGDINLYRLERNLRIDNQILVSIAFKNPKIGEEGYDSDKMMSVLQRVFGQNESMIFDKDSIVKLVHVIGNAREQKHGTMVVITDPDTAKDELIKLRKQSTLIEPTEVNPDHIKFLTSIDGAIYYDTNGECQAIGVILDGIAQEGQGDASRGARYNSALRYLKKLLDNGKKCVIVIISEDGMVDILPEMDDEEKAQRIVEEIIDLLDEEHREIDNLLAEKMAELSEMEITDYHLLLSLAWKLYQKQRYEESLKYYKWAFYEAREVFLPARYHNWMGVCYYALGTEDHYLKAIERFEKANELSNGEVLLYLGNIGDTYKVLSEQKEMEKDRKSLLLQSVDAYRKATALENKRADQRAKYFNKLGLVYDKLKPLASNENEILNLTNEEYNEYSNAINLFADPVYYRNRALTCEELGRFKEATFDFIHAAILNPAQNTLKSIEKLIEDHPEISGEAAAYYNEHCEGSEIKELEDLFENISINIKNDNSEVASTKQNR